MDVFRVGFIVTKWYNTFCLMDFKHILAVTINSGSYWWAWSENYP